MSSLPIPCRYYHLINDGIGIKIWPEIRRDDDHNNVIWEGRNLDGFGLNINEEVTVDFKAVGLAPNTKFILSSNTMFGTDMWNGSPIFIYDPTSTVTVNAVRRGAVDSGGLEFAGLT